MICAAEPDICFLSPGPLGDLTHPLVNQDYDFLLGIGGTGSGPFATNVVPLVWFLWLVKADLKAIDPTRIPNASVNAPSFLDMVPPRNKTHGDTLSFIRIVSSGTHYAHVKKTSMEARLLVSPYLRMAIQPIASDQGELSGMGLSATTVLASYPIGTKVLSDFSRSEAALFADAASRRSP